jgi:glucose/arabinose dehydrogenase
MARDRHALALLAMLALTGCSARAATTTQLHAPPGFVISVVSTRVPGARFLAVAPNGDVLVSQMSRDRVVALTPGASPDAEPKVVITGLPIAHGLAFRGDDLYVAAWSGVTKLHYPPADGTPHETLFSDMPQSGDHNHRAIALAPNGSIFVSSASDCNVCIETEPRLATVLRYDANGGKGAIYASGVRNASGLAFDDAGRLWSVINGRDGIGDDLPPDEVDQIVSGANYGWPYCYAGNGNRVPNPEYKDPAKCAGTHPSELNLQAHVAPLQIAFYRGTQFPARYRGALFVADHGSWNRSSRVGYKVVVVFFENGRPQRAEDFVTGWLHDDQSVSGRPVGVAVAQDGSLYISSDTNGTIYRVTYKP